MSKTTRFLFRYIALIVLSLILGITVLTALGRDTTQLASWLTLAITNFITGTFSILKTEAVERRVTSVEDKVNGRMSQLIRAKTVTAYTGEGKYHGRHQSEE